MPKKLPAPRLELVWKPAKGQRTKWYSRMCIYQLVIPIDRLDIRSNGKATELAIELSRTNVTGGDGNEPPIRNGIVEAPFRDGMHAQWDAASLGGLPVYAKCERTVSLFHAGKPTEPNPLLKEAVGLLSEITSRGYLDPKIIDFINRAKAASPGI